MKISAKIATNEKIILEYVASLNFPNAIPVLWTLTRLKKFGIIDFSSPRSKLYSTNNFEIWSMIKRGNDILTNNDIGFNKCVM